MLASYSTRCRSAKQALSGAPPVPPQHFLERMCPRCCWSARAPCCPRPVRARCTWRALNTTFSALHLAAGRGAASVDVGADARRGGARTAPRAQLDHQRRDPRRPRGGGAGVRGHTRPRHQSALHHAAGTEGGEPALPARRALLPGRGAARRAPRLLSPGCQVPRAGPVRPSNPFAPRSVPRALLTPRVIHGSLYRCDKRA